MNFLTNWNKFYKSVLFEFVKNNPIRSEIRENAGFVVSEVVDGSGEHRILIYQNKL